MALNDDLGNESIRLLLVEDEEDLRDLLTYRLEKAGYQVKAVESGEDGLNAAQADPPHLVLLDLMLPGIDGLAVCRTLKEDPRTADVPIIMVTARGEEADVVRGLDMGADDYVVKPFSPRIVLARLRAVLRRSKAESAADPESPTRIGELIIDPQRHEVRVEGELIPLTITEFRLLELFVHRPGRVMTRHQIIEQLHGQLAAVTDRSVDVQVVGLRKKLGAAADRIETVRGVGYRFQS